MLYQRNRLEVKIVVEKSLGESGTDPSYKSFVTHNYVSGLHLANGQNLEKNLDSHTQYKYATACP